jgi:hypothetical protein
MTDKLKNLLERAAWTAVQAAAGYLAADLADISVAWAPIIAVALSAVKTFAQDKLAARKA